MHSLDYINKSNSEFKDKFGQTLPEELDLLKSVVPQQRIVECQQCLDGHIQLILTHV